MQVSKRIEAAVPALVGALVLVASAVAVTGGAASASPALRGVAALVAGGAAVVAVRRSWWPLAIIGAVLYPWLVMWPPVVVASYYAGTTWRTRRELGAYLGLAVVMMAASVLAGRASGGTREMVTATPANAALMAAAMVGLPLLLGLWVRAKREVLAAARERADRLEREQVMRAEQARAQERARIAREMHDVVAHRVSLMVLHAGALEVGAADERTTGAAAMIGDIGREALTNLREILGVLRGPAQPPALAPQPTLDDLDRLLDQSRALGITIGRHAHGEARQLAATVERTAYRVVQEALTNVHKHAADARTDVHIRYLPAELRVEVRNEPPPGPGRTLPGAGWGLVGLRERVELLGGTLHAGRRDDGGFDVIAAIPAEAAGGVSA
ncbi:sensor histidine kinase [Nonomuraea sp. NPDC003214]